MITRFTNTIAAGLIAAAGLAAPAAAQNSMTSITTNNGEVDGYSTRQVDGVDYRIEFDETGVTAAYADGLEVDFEEEDGTVIVDPDGEAVKFRMPAIGGEGLGGNRFFRVAPRDQRLRGLGVGEGAILPGPNPPKTMVGLTQRPLDEQLRGHLGLEEGVGTMILSVVGGLPAAEAGMKAGDVLISVNGREVTGASVLTAELADSEAGDELDVVVLRKGLPETLTIKVAKFDAEKLYGERVKNQFFPPQAANRLRWNLGDDGFEFDFDEFEDLIRGELADIKDLAPEQQEELDRAMAEARKQIAEAMEQAKQIRGLQWDGDLDLLLRPGDKERAIVIERQAQEEREAVAKRRADLEKEAVELRNRNRELEARLETLEARLDRLIELLEEREGE